MYMTWQALCMFNVFKLLCIMMIKRWHNVPASEYDLSALMYPLICTWWRHQMETFSALLVICEGNSPSPVNSPHKGQWRGALMFTLICARIKAWVNYREAGDLRRNRAHYDVTVMTHHRQQRCQWELKQLYREINIKPLTEHEPPSEYKTHEKHKKFYLTNGFLQYGGILSVILQICRSIGTVPLA